MRRNFTCDNGDALCSSSIHKDLHSLAVCFIDKRTKECICRWTMGCSQLSKDSANTCNEGLGDIAVEYYAGGSGTYLGAVEGIYL